MNSNLSDNQAPIKLSDDELTKLTGVPIRSALLSAYPFWQRVADRKLAYIQKEIRTQAIASTIRRNRLYIDSGTAINLRGSVRFAWQSADNALPEILGLLPPSSTPASCGMFLLRQPKDFSARDCFAFEIKAPKDRSVHAPMDQCHQLYSELNVVGRFKQAMKLPGNFGPAFTPEEAGHLYAHQTMQRMELGQETREASLHADYLKLAWTQSFDNYTAPRIDSLIHGKRAPTREQVRDAVHHIRLRLYFEILGLETLSDKDIFKRLRKSNVVTTYKDFEAYKASDAYPNVRQAMVSRAFQKSARHWRTGDLRIVEDLGMSAEGVWNRLYNFAVWGMDNFSGHPELPLTLLKEKVEQRAFVQPLVRSIAQKIVEAGEYFYGPGISQCPNARDLAYDLDPRPKTLPKRTLG